MSVLGVVGLRNLRHQVASYSPRFLSNRGPGLRVGAGVLYTLAAVLDILTEVQLQGAFAAMPGLGTPGALPLIGFTRGITRGFAETDAGYSARLIQWLDLWRFAGRPVGMLLAVLGCFSPVSLTVRTVDNTGNWYWYNAGSNPFPPGTSVPAMPNFLLQQGNWNWDGLTAPWHRYWVIVYVGPLGWTVGTAGPKWGDGGKWGAPGRLWGISGATYGQLQALRAVVRSWKAAHVYVPNIILTANTARFDPTHAAGGGVNPDGTWGNPANRFSDCIYLDGVI